MLCFAKDNNFTIAITFFGFVFVLIKEAVDEGSMKTEAHAAGNSIHYLLSNATRIIRSYK